MTGPRTAAGWCPLCAQKRCASGRRRSPRSAGSRRAPLLDRPACVGDQRGSNNWRRKPRHRSLLRMPRQRRWL